MVRSRNIVVLMALGFAALSGMVTADESSRLRLPPESERSVEQTESLPVDLLQQDSIRKVGSALVIVFGCVVLWTALQRSTQRRAPNTGLMRPLGVVQLTPKVKLHVVQLGRRLLVLHLTGGRVERIAEISDPEEVASFVGAQSGTKLTGSPRVEQLLRAAQEPTETAYPRGTLG